MALNVSQRKNTSTGAANRVPQENIKVGGHPARLVQIIDLGLQSRPPFKGTPKAPEEMIYATYELSHVFMKDAAGKEEPTRPRWVSEDFVAYSLEAEKAKSTTRYLALDPERTFKGDFSKVLGKPCTVVIVHNKSGDRTFDNVGDVTPAPQMPGYIQPELVNPPVIFDLGDPDIAVFNKLPAFIQDRIKGNLNYNGSLLQKLLGETSAGVTTGKAEVPVEAAEGEDNPY